MTRNLIVVLAACLLATCALRGIDSTWNYAVEINASVQASPPQIALSWLQSTDGTPASYTVYRKAPADTSWGSPIVTLSGTTLNYTDANVTVGTAYEYQIVKDFTAALGYTGYGYIQSGINVPAVDTMGTVILVVDNTYAANLAPGLQRLMQDLVADGWVVIRHDVGRGSSVESVKALIMADYTADPADVNTVFLFGHVPVPYSGLLNPDGHPEHLGAWPADVYYGDMVGQWTDTTVNYVQTMNSDPADAARISNVPGDGKFDQTTIPAVVKLKVGRVDLANMPGDLQYDADPSFPSEQALLQRYLDKDHNFRTAQLNPQRRALIADYAGSEGGSAYAAAGFRSFAPLVGNSATSLVNLNIEYDDALGYWVPTLQNNDYLLAIGTAAGSYTSASDLGVNPPYNYAYTTDIVSDDVRASFVMLFGSWYGDWDHQDDFLRSILATPTYGLAAMFNGPPHWYLHPMGLGETIGYCARLTQNNTSPGLYQTQVNECANEVHIALMGDPTLRLFSVAPASSLTAAPSGNSVTLNWLASPDEAVVGYHVYRGSSASGPFTRLTNAPIAATTFTDSTAPSGASYMVRAIKLETTPSGTFFNPSAGVIYVPNGGATTSPAPPASGARLVNVSLRSNAGTGSQTVALGFVIGGAGTSGSLPLLIRASGPALQPFGVTGVLPDPVLTLFQGTTVVGSDDNWGSNAAQVSAVASAVGAFPFPDPTSLDAALTATYGPGAYSAQVTGNGGSSGIALAEVYDATPPASYTATTPRLINVSARTMTGTGPNILIVGFVVAGSGNEQVLIRGIGPSLAKYGVTGVLALPQLKLLDGNGNVLATNTGWGGDPTLAAVFTQVGAFTLDPTSVDSALVATLSPGAYTAQVSGADGGTGVALAEIYEVK